MGTVRAGAVSVLDRRPIGVFIDIDRLGATVGAALLIVANGLILQAPMVWLILPFIVLLVAALTAAKRQLGHDRVLVALALITLGNWAVALVVAFILPFLWPVMVITVMMPVVLDTPYLNRSQLLVVIASTGLAGALVAAIGLLNDDGGAVPDVDEVLEFGLVVGGLAAHMAPAGLLVWHNNRMQLESLEEANRLNADLRRVQDQLLASRRRVVEAADVERRRIERDLHDGAQQRLVALGVRLRLLESQTTARPEIHGAVEALVAELDEAVEEVRELAHGIYPPLLQSQGLVPALSAVARRSPLEVRTAIDDVGRLPVSVETALYFTALEALTNTAKHAPGASVDLTLSRTGSGEGHDLRLVVTDDGPGFEVDDEIRSQGTHNMGDRLAAVGGELVIHSQLGRGTTVTASVVDGAVTAADR